MADAQVTGQRPPAKRGALRNPIVWIAVLGVAVGAGAWILWRSRSASSASTATTGGTDTTATDEAGQISTLQSEIGDLQSSIGQGAGSGTGGGSGGTAGGGTGTGLGTGGSGSGTGGSTGGGGTPSPPPSGGSMPPGPPGVAVPPKAVKPPVPSGVHPVRVTPTSVELAWNKSAGASDYRCRVTYQGKLVGQRTASTPAITMNGLTPNHTYTFHVAASNAGGMSVETNGPVVKTPRASAAPKAEAVSTRKVA